MTTHDGLFWFKEVGSALSFEPLLTERLARQVPRCFPDVLAIEGRMLTVDAGRKLPKPADLSTFRTAVDRDHDPVC